MMPHILKEALKILTCLFILRDLLVSRLNCQLYLDQNPFEAFISLLYIENLAGDVCKAYQKSLLTLKQEIKSASSSPQICTVTPAPGTTDENIDSLNYSALFFLLSSKIK